MSSAGRSIGRSSRRTWWWIEACTVDALATCMHYGSSWLMATTRRWWSRYGQTVLTCVAVSMAAAAVWRLGHALPLLIWGEGGYSAFDLQLRHREVGRWFAGLSVYGDIERGDYPPASYLILWPLLGWLDVFGARILWALTSLAALVWLALTCARESQASSRPEVWVCALLPFSIYASASTITLGQVGVHLLPMLVVGLLLLLRGRGRWWEDLIAVGLLLPTLAKPSLSVPFIFIVLLAVERLRPATLIVGGYLALTGIAITFQPGNPVVLATAWLGEPPQMLQGTANLQKALVLLGLRDWALFASIGCLLVLGWWVYRHRHSDPWLLIAVCALAARLVIHHRLYDDLLILLPMVALFRMRKMRPSVGSAEMLASLLFIACWVSLHIPASLIAAGGSVATSVEMAQAGAWIGTLGFLLIIAERQRLFDPSEVGPLTASTPRRSEVAA
jgi:hypothetical protein